MDQRRYRSGSIPRDDRGLTKKQGEFVEAMVEYKDLEKAFRDVYDCTNLPHSAVLKKASDLMDRPAVRRRMAELVGELGGEYSLSYAKLTSRYIMERLKAEATDKKNPANVRVRALELLGKTNDIDLFGDKGEQSQEDSRSAEDIERDLLNKITDLVGTVKGVTH